MLRIRMKRLTQASGSVQYALEKLWFGMFWKTINDRRFKPAKRCVFDSYGQAARHGRTLLDIDEKRRQTLADIKARRIVKSKVVADSSWAKSEKL